MKTQHFIGTGAGMLALILLLNNSSAAQGVTVGAPNPPDPSAVLDVQSNTSGFLLPRLTTAQRNAIVNPAIGLQVYNTDTDCLELFFASGGWKPVQCGCTAFPNATFNVTTGTINSPVTIASSVPNMTYSWTFQNGSPSNSSSQSTQVTWANAGTYSVNLTLTDSAGCSASFSDNITISACSPVNLTLTNCGQTGRYGPNQTQADATYGPGIVSVTNGIQFWTVPQTGTYTITARGAEGGRGKTSSTNVYSSGVPGKGAVMQGEFTLTAGTVLKILVGQQGGELTTNNQKGGGGGGGTFVALANNTPLLVAGGGGGSGRYNGDNGNGGTITTSGSNGNGSSVGVGGAGGNGGTASSCGYGGGGGAGFTGNGTNINSGHALSFINGGDGASIADNWIDGNIGGFGGGAGTGPHGGGGGGGYSGGGGGGDINCGGNGGGGGGGSFNNGTNPVNTPNSNSGHGSVIISLTCP